MRKQQKTSSLFDQLKSGLEDSIAFSKGELSLKTIEAPPPPPQAGAQEVRRLRRSLRMSQAVFAATLNVSQRTVQSWEQGLRDPSDASLRMIQIVGQSPGVVAMLYDRRGRRR